MKRLKLCWFLIIAILLAGCTLVNFGQEEKPVVDKFALEYKQFQKYITEGDKALKEDKLNEALEAYQKAAEIKPEVAEIHTKIGQIYLRQQKYKKAIDAFKTGLEYAPSNIDVRNYLGYLYEKTDENEKATSQYEKVLDSKPENLYALNHVGLMYYKLGKLDRAEKVLRKAIKIDPDLSHVDNKNAHNYLGLVYEEKGEIGEAIAEYRESIRLNPDDLWARKHLASLYEENGRYFEAQLIYLEILEIEPDNAWAKARLKALEQLTYPQTITEVEPVEIINENVDSIIVEAPSRERYPEADAVILLDKFSHEILEDASSRYTVHKIIKIFTERGIKKYGEVAVAFQSQSQNIGVNIARTILPDGTVIEPPDEAYNDITAPGLVEYNLFSDMMWKVVSMSALSPGVIIEYKITVEDAVIETDSQNEDDSITESWFWGDMSFQSTEPTLQAKCELQLPESLNFKWKTYNSQFEPDVSIKNGKLIYIWDYGKAEALEVEPSMPPLREVVPRLSYSSVNSWQKVREWYYDLAKEQYDTDESIQNKVKGLIQDAKDTESKIRAIYNFVATEIRYVGIELGVGAYKPSSAVEVFKNRYGDCKDKVTLLIAMLKLAKVKAYPGMINPAPYAKIDVELPSPSQFAHLICAIPKEELGEDIEKSDLEAKDGNQYLWLDPTVETCSYGLLPYSDQGRQVFVITESDGFFVTTPIDHPEANKFSIFADLMVDRSGKVNGVENVKATGEFAIDYRFIYKAVKPKDRVEFFEMILNPKYPGVKVHDVKISGLNNLDIPLETVVEFSADNYAFDTEEQFIIPIPDDNFSEQAALVSMQERKYQLQTEYPMQIQKEVTVHTDNIPNYYVLSELHPPVDMEYDFGKFNRHYILEGKTVKYSLNYIINDSSISPSEYHQFKRFIETVSREDKIQLIYKDVKSGS